MPSNHLIFCCTPLLPPSIFPSIKIFSNESAICIRWQSIGASVSASVLPKNIQDWFPLGLTGLILQSKGLSKVFSNTTVQKHQFFGAQLSLQSNYFCLERRSPLYSPTRSSRLTHSPEPQTWLPDRLWICIPYPLRWLLIMSNWTWPNRLLVHAVPTPQSVLPQSSPPQSQKLQSNSKQKTSSHYPSLLISNPSSVHSGSIFNIHESNHISSPPQSSPWMGPPTSLI